MSHPLQPERDTRFLRLYAESEGSIQAFVRSLVPTRQMASEVMQDVILVLWQKYEEALDFKSWSLGVARNVVLQHLRRVSRDRHVFDDALVNQLADDAATLAEVHDRQREALEGCLAKLSESQRQLVLSAYAKGTRIDQLAQQRGRSPMALYKALHRIRRALLECIERTLGQQEYA
jgi:RNA polymerase sigma-70 factor (ECF subfamily)